MIPTPSLELCFTLVVELGEPIELGQGRAGQRRIIPIIGGSATGKITGRVLNLGADWQTVYGDGAAHLDTRYGVETIEGAVIEVANVGARHGPPDVIAKLAAGQDVNPSEYYMRTAARLETGHEGYAWVNHTLFLCAGIRHASSVEIAFYEVL